MSSLNRGRYSSQQLLTIPQLRAIDAGVTTDLQALYQNLISGITSSYIISGLTINITGSSFSSAASTLTINTANSLILATLSAQSGSLLPINGTTADSLNSALNPNIIGSFSANSTNYVSIDLIREADTNSSDTIFLWNATQLNTIKRQQYTNTILSYRIYISTVAPSANQLLIAEVVTNSLGIPTTINDCRNLLFRLGTGGIAPNPFYTYPWPQGRNENSFSSSSSAVNPFVGGDKSITSLQTWMAAVMTEIKLVKGSPFWYSTVGSGGGGSNGSLLTIDEDANLSYATSPGPPPGVMHYNAAVTGDMYWDQPVYIRSMVSSQYYKINSTSQGSLVLNDQDVSFISLNRYITLSGNLSFSPSLSGIPAAVVSAAGSNGAFLVSGTAPVFTGMTSGISGNTGNGDFIKAIVDSNESFDQVATFFDNTGATSSASSAYYAVLNNAYTGTTGVQVGEYSQTYYTGSSITKAPRSIALSYTPLGSMYWIGYRDNTNIYTHWLGALRPGEDRQIDNETSNDLLTYIGAPNESVTIPNYSATPTTGWISANSGEVNYSSSSTDDLTTRAARLTSMLANEAQNKNIAIIGGGTVINSGGLVTWNAAITINIGGPTGLITNSIASGSADLSASNYRCAYVTINRNASVTQLNVSVTTIDLLPLSENVFTIIQKFDSSSVVLGISGQSYIVISGGQSSSGFSPAPEGSLGVANIHKFFVEKPAGSINGINGSFTLAQTPFSSTSLLLFKNGLFQYQNSTGAGDYSVVNNQITMTVFPNTNDELVAIYARGNNIIYNYVQEHHVSVATTNTFALTTPLTVTTGAAVFLDGLLRHPGATSDYIASPASVVFNYTVTANTKMDVFYLSSGDNLYPYNYQLLQSSNSSRSTYAFYGDLESTSAFLLGIDGVGQFPVNNTINNTSVTVIDYLFTSPNTININNAVLTTTSVISLWVR